MEKRNPEKWLLLLAGLFNGTRINLGGSIALTELAFVVAAPFLIFKSLPMLRRTGLSSALWLMVLWLGGALFSDLVVNHTYLPFALKGIATPVVMISSLICLAYLLKRDITNVRWYVVGSAFTIILSTFFLSRASSLGLDMSAESALERTVGYKLYWLNLITAFILIPVKGWYVKVPQLYSKFAVIASAVFALLEGVRNVFLSYSVSFVLILVGERSVTSMIKLKRHIILVLAAISLVGLGVKVIYKKMASSGYMGESEQRKYELQTRESDSTLAMLMAGRVEFFVGVVAASRRPIVGRGSWALDSDNIFLEYMSKYGTEADYKKAQDRTMKIGSGITLIPFHSHIVTYWMWHGVFGLVFWLFALCLVIKTLISRMHVVPELFGYLALVLPLFVWNMFFSPLGDRVGEVVIITICLMLRYISKNQKRLFWSPR